MSVFVLRAFLTTGNTSSLKCKIILSADCVSNFTDIRIAIIGGVSTIHVNSRYLGQQISRFNDPPVERV